MNERIVYRHLYPAKVAKMVAIRKELLSSAINWARACTRLTNESIGSEAIALIDLALAQFTSKIKASRSNSVSIEAHGLYQSAVQLYGAIPSNLKEFDKYWKEFDVWAKQDITIRTAYEPISFSFMCAGYGASGISIGLLCFYLTSVAAIVLTSIFTGLAFIAGSFGLGFFLASDEKYIVEGNAMEIRDIERLLAEPLPEKASSGGLFAKSDKEPEPSRCFSWGICGA